MKLVVIVEFYFKYLIEYYKDKVKEVTVQDLQMVL